MDVQMPVMDGLSARRAIRQIESAQHQPRTPIIALSASVQLEDRQAAIAAGMDGICQQAPGAGRTAHEMARVTDQLHQEDRRPAAPPRHPPLRHRPRKRTRLMDGRTGLPPRPTAVRAGTDELADRPGPNHLPG